MIRPRLVVPLLLLVALGAACAEEAGPPEPRIQRWPEGKRAALSFTFDDGYANNVEIAAPLLEEYGMRGTFFIVASWAWEPEDDWRTRKRYSAGWADWVALAERGHEIGSHSMTHLDLQTVTAETQLRQEIGSAARLIEQKIGRVPYSFAYPQSRRNDRAEHVIREYHALVRGPCRIYGGEGFTLEKANSWVDEALAGGDWMIAMLHAVGEDRGYQPTDAELFAAHLAYVAEQTDELWVDTHEAIGRYVAERDAATITVVERKPTSLTFTLTLPDDMRPQWFDVPLEVVIDLPEAIWGASAARPGGTVGMRYDAAVPRVVLDVVPGPQPVTVSWGG